MNHNDIDQIRLIAEYTRRRQAEINRTPPVDNADASRRSNLLVLAAKCGEVLARTLYGIDIRRHTRED